MYLDTFYSVIGLSISFNFSTNLRKASLFALSATKGHIQKSLPLLFYFLFFDFEGVLKTVQWPKW